LTKASVCIEAKSKHHGGALGMAGEREPDDEIGTRLGGLINDALKKPHWHPLAIFLACTFRQRHPCPGTPEWFKRFADPILRGIDCKGQEDPWDLLVFLNQPDHYATKDGSSSGWLRWG
jgi:hypothetical protein